MAGVVSDLAEFHSRQASENAGAPLSAVELLNFTKKDFEKKNLEAPVRAPATAFAGYCCVKPLFSRERRKYSSSARYQVSETEPAASTAAPSR